MEQASLESLVKNSQLVSRPLGVAAEQPKSVFDLLNGVPHFLSTSQQALRWIDKEWRPLPSIVLVLKEEIKHDWKGSQQLTQADTDGESRASLILGRNHVGIDEARLQSDLVYFAEIMAKFQSMTMEEK